jgi:antitoxin MazE6
MFARGVIQRTVPQTMDANRLDRASVDRHTSAPVSRCQRALFDNRVPAPTDPRPRRPESPLQASLRNRNARFDSWVPASLIRPSGCGYTFGMKTAISIPDDLFRRADELASRMGKSRSEVYRDALADYVARRDPAAVTRALDEIADELSDNEREFTAVVARRTLAQSEW